MSMEITYDKSSMYASKTIVWILRISVFTYYFAVGCIQSFSAIILRRAHVSQAKIGTNACIGLIGGTISPIIVGVLADKTKKSKLILLILAVGSFVFHCLPIILLATMFPTPNKPVAALPPLNSSATPQVVVNKPPSDGFIFLIYIIQFIITFCDQGLKGLQDGTIHKILGKCREYGIAVDYSRIRMFGGMGLATSGLVSGFGLQYLKGLFPNFQVNYFLIILCLSFGSVYLFLIITFLPSLETQGKVSLLSAIRSIFTSCEVLVCYFTQMGMQFALNLTRAFDPLFITHLGGDRAMVGGCTFAGYMADVCMMYFSPIIFHAMGAREMVIVLSGYISMGRCLVFSFADTPYLAFNNAIMNGFCLGLLLPTMSNLVKSKAPEDLVSSYVSILVGMGKIGGAAGSQVGGIITERLSYRAMYLTSAFSFLITATFMLVSTLCARFFNWGKDIDQRNIKTCEDTTLFEVDDQNGSLIVDDREEKGLKR